MLKLWILDKNILKQIKFQKKCVTCDKIPITMSTLHIQNNAPATNAYLMPLQLPTNSANCCEESLKKRYFITIFLEKDQLQFGRGTHG